MGGAKSKPQAYASSASTLLSKRAVDPSIPKSSTAAVRGAGAEAGAGNPNANDDGNATIARINNHRPIRPPLPAAEEFDLPPNFIAQISKWNTVTSKVDEAAIKLRTQGETMASMVRHKEETSLMKNNRGFIPKKVVGKLTEDQLMDMLRGVRDHPTASNNSVEKLTEKLFLKENIVRDTLQYARYANITPQKNNPNLLIGR